jgi:regulator of sigma E protease
MSVIIFLFVLFVLILVHEWGHFIAAKKTGMRVDEFAIGFPPKLFGLKKGETEYSFNILPIGGFVRIFGENPDALVDSDPDKARAFGSRPKWAQAIVLVAGVTMNVIFAWFLFLGTYLVGVPTAVEEINASPEAVLYVSDILPNGPLFEKLPAGAEVQKLVSGADELASPVPSSFSSFIQSHADTPVTIYYRYGETESSAEVMPELGLIASDETKAAVGVSLAMVETADMGFLEAVSAASSATYYGLINITVGLTTLLSQSVQGTADFTQVAGPVGIVGMVGDAANFGIVALLTFTAMISLNLAVINMLPIPALDGGRLLFVAIEAVTRRPINPVWMGRVNLVGFVLLMALMLIVTWNDIAKLI